MPKKQKSVVSELAKILRTTAMELPDTEEGIACAGTSLEKRTIKVRGKAFLFVGQADAMLKLSESLPMATKVAGEHPDHFKVGAHGWTTIRFAWSEALPINTLQSWIGESYRLFATLTTKSGVAKKKVASTTKAAKKKR
jgi:hypothetical protein